MSARPAIIGITACSASANYTRWLQDPSVEAVVITVAADADRCDGIVFSGGEDLHPERYQRPELAHKLDMKAVSEARDALEWQILDRALKTTKPLLGICRGLQLINVFLGGSLIYDIPEVLSLDTHGSIRTAAAKTGALKRRDQRHAITVAPGSLLHSIAKATTGEINSSHHQSADVVSEQLSITGTAEESVVEALEWKQPEGKQWLLCVQWHPERMADQDNPFAGAIRGAYLNAVRTAIA